jgi:hypothetical protein
MGHRIAETEPTTKMRKEGAALGVTIVGILGAFVMLTLGVLIGRYSSPAPSEPQRAATAVATAELTTYTSASEMHARLAGTALPCEGMDRNGTADGTNVGCWLSQHYASLRTFAHTKLTTAADLPIRNRDGQMQLVITGRNWEVHVTADKDPEVNKRLAEHVAKTLGGTIISAG